MKSRIQTMLVLVVVSVSSAGLSYAQSGGGTVNFVNSTATSVTNGLTSNPVSGADEVQAALYWAPSALTNFVQIGASVAVGYPLQGIYAGGTRTTTNTPGGGTGWFRVRAWGGGFTNYEEALAHPGVLVGESAILQATTGNPEGSPPTPPASLLGSGLQSFTLTATPLPPPVIRNAVIKSPGDFQLCIVSMPGREVAVQTSTNLLNWVSLGSFYNIPGEICLSIPATNTISYFRVIQF
jgi:hypothetical protein